MPPEKAISKPSEEEGTCYVKKVGNMSLRMRVTLFAAMTMIIACTILSYFILKNVNLWIVTYEPATPPTGSDIIQTDPYTTSPDGTDEAYQSASIGREYVALNRSKFLRTCMAIVLCTLFPGILIIYFIMGFALKPVYQFNKNIAEISANNLGKRIDSTSNGVELNSLACSFNQLLARIEVVLEQEKAFAAGASHELKTPLAVVKTNLDVLYMSNDPSKEELAETMQVVENQTNRMIKLVDDLFAMYELREYDLSEVILVDKVIDEVVSEQTGNLEQKQLHIRVSHQKCRIQGNREMFKHAISNLLQNAIKFNTVNGQVEIAVKTTENDCVIRVLDTGIGISPEAAEHIFEAFYREDKSRSRKIGGAGLGLSIVKTIVEQHGGTVQYQPNDPKGSVFIISVPRMTS